MNKKFFLSLFSCLLPLFFLLFPLSTLAVGLPYWGPLVSCTGTECNTCHLFSTAQMVIYFLMTLTLFVVGPIMVTAGGIMMLIAAGSQERFTSGRKIATGAVVGIFIGLVSFLIVNTLLVTISKGISGFSGSGFTITCSAKSPFVPPQSQQNQSGPPAGMMCPPSSNWVTASGRCEYGDGSSATPIQNPNGSNSYVGQQDYTDPSVPRNVNIPGGSGNVEDYTYPRDMGE